MDEIWNSVSQMLGLALADFGRDPRSSDSLRGSQKFFCPVNNALFQRFPFGQILRHFNTTNKRRSFGP